jgi:Fe-S oxidoreductase
MLNEVQKIYLENMARDFGLDEVYYLCPQCYTALKKKRDDLKRSLKGLKDKRKDYQTNSNYEMAKEELKNLRETINNLRRTSVQVVQDIFGEVLSVCDGSDCQGLNKVVYVEILEDCFDLE